MAQSLLNRLDQRVRIEQPTTTSDGAGGQVVMWAELATVYAEVVPVGTSLSERNVAEQLQARAGYRVTIRARTDVTAAMRLIWKTHTLQIVSMHARDAMLEMVALEVGV